MKWLWRGCGLQRMWLLDNQRKGTVDRAWSGPTATVKWESWETSIQEMWIRCQEGDTVCSTHAHSHTCTCVCTHHTHTLHRAIIYIYTHTCTHTHTHTHIANFTNPMSYSPEFLIIQHLRRVVPIPVVLFFIRKKYNDISLEAFMATQFCPRTCIAKSFINETGSSLGHVLKEHINPCGISWSLVSYFINFLAMRTPGNRTGT